MTDRRPQVLALLSRSLGVSSSFAVALIAGAAGALLVATFAGCGQGGNSDTNPPTTSIRSKRQTGRTGTDNTAASRGGKTTNQRVGASIGFEPRPRTNEQKVASALPAPPPAEVYPPTIAMSAAHAATCLVSVGDRMPAIDLNTIDVQIKRLEDLYGERLTVVVFWTSQNPMAREQFTRLTRDIVDPFSKYGVNTVAVNLGDDGLTVGELCNGEAAKFECMFDLTGNAFAKVATRTLPRTYLLDSSGRILWLDQEYSQTTRRELQNAILFYLQREI
jgi:peroxiredoxin